MPSGRGYCPAPVGYLAAASASQRYFRGMALCLSGDAKADALLTKDALALLVGMVLDQQVPLEWAFSAPLELQRRLGGKLDVKAIAEMDPAALASAFSERPALHRYPSSMAQRVQELCRLVVEDYSGNPKKIWTGAKDGKELLARLKQLPGFGDQKARIFLALLGKQLGVKPPGWEEASSPFGEPGSLRSVADIVDSASLDRVRAAKQAAKAAAKAAASEKVATTTGTGKGRAGAKAKKASGSTKKAAPARA
jgi:uncharacterized HhH-GPD family protein